MKLETPANPSTTLVMRDGKPHFSIKTPIGNFIVNPVPRIASVVNRGGSQKMQVNQPVYAVTIENFEGADAAQFKGYSTIQTFDPETTEVRTPYQILMDPDKFQLFDTETGESLIFPTALNNFDPFSL